MLYGQLLLKTDIGILDLADICKLSEFYLVKLMQVCILV